jgi:putative ubiquitin-RnfH superfamily antitoxin RatB of RatAB toxin-antitoxin module
MMKSTTLTIEIAYACVNIQKIITIKVPLGATIEVAIMRSGILTDFPEINLSQNNVGIFSKVAKLDTVLRDKDRIEIYRPLLADPKEIRRRRAAEGKIMKKGN